MFQHPPLASLVPNSLEFETLPLIKPTGFREYDARWWFGLPAHPRPPELNLCGVQALGAGLGTLMHMRGIAPEIVTGHDFRQYSLSIKQALTVGLMEAGITVHDIGLALSPMAYFAQIHLKCPAVAMVTASHNENGWTGVKMGIDPPLTFTPDDMRELRDIVLNARSQPRPGGAYGHVDGMRAAYMADLTKNIRLSRPLKVVAACGNGTAGVFAEPVLRQIGAEVIPIECDLDYTFPQYNPNPEDLKMLHAMCDAVLTHKADVALGFDGDGDRCGVVDNEGEEIFADKVGVILARDLSHLYKPAQFVVDVKSTGLFHTDPVLMENAAKTDYYKTGHSYIKHRCKELGALAGFEKSGHYFFNTPIGHGYDCGLTSAIAILQMLDRHSNQSLADLRRALPQTWASPTMSPACADECKYDVVARITSHYQQLKAEGISILGQPIRELMSINGIRVILEDGTWGLIRASSNSPNLVIVVESPTSEQMRDHMFCQIESLLSEYAEVGEYDQKL